MNISPAAIASSFSRSSRLIVVALIAAAGAAGCSSSNGAAPADAGDGACAALATCCASFGPTPAASCQAMVTAAREAQSDATCASTLLAYEESGLCGGGGLDAGGGLPIVCAGSGTCGEDAGAPPSNSGYTPPTDGNGDTVSDGGAAATGQDTCVNLGTCSDGTQYEMCTAIRDAGACVAAVLVGDEVLPCASCTDCSAAASTAAAMCVNGATTTPVDAGPDCGSPPALHPETDAGVYCPFTATGSIHCAAGEQCCESPGTSSGESTCGALGAACPIAGSLTWACDGPADCAGSGAGAVCCAAGAVANDPVCGFDRGSGFQGSHCAQACAGGEVTVCSSATDPCPSGTMCEAFKVAGVVLGACE